MRSGNFNAVPAPPTDNVESRMVNFFERKSVQCTGLSLSHNDLWMTVALRKIQRVSRSSNEQRRIKNGQFLRAEVRAVPRIKFIPQRPVDDYCTPEVFNVFPAPARNNVELRATHMIQLSHNEQWMTVALKLRHASRSGNETSQINNDQCFEGNSV